MDTVDDAEGPLDPRIQVSFTSKDLTFSSKKNKPSQVLSFFFSLYFVLTFSRLYAIMTFN